MALLGTWAAAPAAEGFVYWADDVVSGTIGRANLDGSGRNESFIRLDSGPCGVAVDGAHIYWGGFETIGRADLDGSRPDQTFVRGAANTCGVAVDGAHIYWGNRGTKTIGRANLDGSGADESFITGANGPCGVAVDAAHIYWTNSAGDQRRRHHCRRANLDGTSPNQRFITGASGPCGVAVDAGHIYWANTLGEGGNTIGRANLDGTSPSASFITRAGAPCGVAVDAAHLYWAASVGSAIERANLDGTGVNRRFILGPEGACGVAVDAMGPPPPTRPIKATISSLSETNKTFTVASTSTPLIGHTAARREKRGTVFAFRLDQRATVKIAIRTKVHGRRVGRICKLESRRLHKHARCSRTISIATLTRTAHAGLNKIPFTGRMRGKALKPGRYQAAFTAIDAAGASPSRSLRFTIVKRLRKYTAS